MPKSGVYKIAKYIPLALRRQMVAVRYSSSSSSAYPYPVCATGKCPLGWLPGMPSPQPWPHQIAVVLRRIGTPTARRTPKPILERLATAFTDDWDAGEIKNLRTALGVPKAAK